MEFDAVVMQRGIMGTVFIHDSAKMLTNKEILPCQPPGPVATKPRLFVMTEEEALKHKLF